MLNFMGINETLGKKCKIVAFDDSVTVVSVDTYIYVFKHHELRI